MIAPASDSIVVPSSYAIRLSIRSPLSWVVVAPPGVTPTPEGVLAAPSVSAMLTHEGVSWPDAVGAASARRMLAAGGCVSLVFGTLADALSCHGRLMRERVR